MPQIAPAQFRWNAVTIEAVMSDESATQHGNREAPVALGNLPREELLRYGADLGLEFGEKDEREEIVSHIRERQELLLELDRGALMDIVEWGRRPVSNAAGKEELACAIARVDHLNYEGLTHRGLTALTRLRGLGVHPADRADEIIARLRKDDGFWKLVKRKRRAWVGSLLEKLVAQAATPAGGAAPPPTDQPEPTLRSPPEPLRKEIEERGLVGGLAYRIRGAADDYVRVKLDEIEARIDAKLDQIDQRLAEWRDREVANRLKILRITLIFTVLVAILSLGYNILKTRVAPPEASPPRQSSVDR